ncbi:MAG TPA: biotin--[acetyl-CoA-carboxylase] ligase [Candidatus Krumholzibacteria bacterium]|nr:biotin--[acetyl-CoA-carboxylase] ligase [Candidatus Krumholzibacteria bacterium]
MNTPVCGPLPADVQRHLATARLGRRMYFHPDVTSTNDIALDLARHGEPEGTVVIADHQRAGRGRRGRVWSSPPQRNLMLSMILRPGSDARGALPVTLVSAMSISVVLSKLLDIDVRVKWPNDVVCERGKIAGILAESSVSGSGLAFVVVGTGINVNARAEDLPAAPAYPAASCFTLTGSEWDRAKIAADVLGTIEAYYDRFLRDGFATLRGAYEARLAHLGRRVAFEQQGRQADGVVLGVAGDGALRVESSGGGETLLYGESIEVLP